MFMYACPTNTVLVGLCIVGDAFLTDAVLLGECSLEYSSFF